MNHRMNHRDPSARSLTYSEYVVDHLRADIVTGRFAPRAKLAMKTLSERYQVGLSPIREALHRLVGEGFVHAVGQQGFSVPPLSLEDLEDLSALRALVEDAAIRQAVARGDDAWEAGIVAAFHRLEKQTARLGSTQATAIRQYDDVHRAFHVALFADVASPRLAALQATLFDQAFRYRKALHGQALSSDDVAAEHRDLKEAVLSRDADRAAATVRKHLDLTRAHVAGALSMPAGAEAARR